MNRYFPQKEIWMANTHMKRCLISLAIKKILIKTQLDTIIYPLEQLIFFWKK